MPSVTIEVHEGTEPGDQTFVMRDFRNASDPTAVVDITGYAFKLIVKRELDDPDSACLFDLTGSIVTAADGTYKFTLTLAHTCMPAGDYIGQIRWWSGGAPGTEEQPTDAIDCTYRVIGRVRLNEP